MPTYLILATRRIELRGEVTAKNREDAMRIAKENWQIYDTDNNMIGIDSIGGNDPIVSEHEEEMRILYVEDKDLVCEKCGQYKHKGPCKFDRVTLIKDRYGYSKKVYRKSD